MEQLQSHIWGRASLYMMKCANISPYSTVYEEAAKNIWLCNCNFLSVQAGRETGGICFAQISTFSPTKMYVSLIYWNKNQAFITPKNASWTYVLYFSCEIDGRNILSRNFGRFGTTSDEEINVPTDPCDNTTLKLTLKFSLVVSALILYYSIVSVLKRCNPMQLRITV